MKKIVLALALLISSVFAEGIHWAKDYESGIAQAMKEHKPVFFVFSRTTCKYCVILEKNTFSDKRVIDALNKDFVSIIAYSDKGDRFPEMLWRPGTPTLWFLKSDGLPLFQPLMGAVRPEYLLKAMEVVKTEFEKQEKAEKKK